MVLVSTSMICSAPKAHSFVSSASSHAESLKEFKEMYIEDCDKNRPEKEENFGEIDSCFLAAYYNKDTPEKALLYYIKSCDREFWEACRVLHEMEKEKGNQTKSNEYFMKTAKFNKKGMKTRASWRCQNKNDANACNEAAGLEEENKNIDAAKNLYEKACNLKFYEACSNLGLILKEQSGALGGIVRATELQKKACDNKYLLGCAALGQIESEKGNDETAIKLFKKSCTGKSNIGCTAMGLIYLKVGKSKQGKAALNKSCDAKNSMACEILVSLNKGETPKTWLKALDQNAWKW